MPFLESNGQKVELDDDGFLVDMEQWSEKVAQAMTAREEVEELSEEAMEILRFMRSYYRKFHAFPILNYVCKNIHQPRNCVQEKFLDPMKAWKLAGLPKPGVVATESTDERHKIYHWLVPD
jgi:dissimilatory sulfite reductase related protein